MSYAYGEDPLGLFDPFKDFIEALMDSLLLRSTLSPEGESAVGPRQGLPRRGGGRGSEGAESEHQVEDTARAGHPLPRVLDRAGVHLPDPQPR